VRNIIRDLLQFSKRPFDPELEVFIIYRHETKKAYEDSLLEYEEEFESQAEVSEAVLNQASQIPKVQTVDEKVFTDDLEIGIDRGSENSDFEEPGNGVEQETALRTARESARSDAGRAAGWD